MAFTKKQTTALATTVSKSQSVELRRLDLVAQAQKLESQRLELDAQLKDLAVERNNIKDSFTTELAQAEIDFKEKLSVKQSEFDAKCEEIEAAYNEKQDEINAKIANLTVFLNQKQEEYKRNLEELAYNNKLAVRDNQLSMISEIARNNGLSIISSKDLDALNVIINDAEKNQAIAINAAVKNAKDSLTSEYSEKIQSLEVAAQLAALNTKALEKENANLLAQVAELKAVMATKDLQTIEMLKAAQSNVNVTSGK